MSISSILYTATSALSVAQTRISITSTNIANAETEGYTKKTAYVTTSVVGGQATGVQVIGTGNDVDEKLFAGVMDATTDSAYDSILSSYYETLLTALGTTADGSAISEALTDLQTALSSAIEDPSSTSAADDVTEALQAWADAVTDASDSVQSARTSADQAIAESVETVNDLLHRIDDLNDRITKASANGDSTADLEDQRRTALEELSGYMDITTFTTSSGAVRIYTSSGQALLTSTVHELSYAATGTLTADTVYDSGGSGAISGIMLDGEDVTGKIEGGSIGALIEMRDEILPGIQAELDELSDTVKDAVNAAANAGTPVPAPNSLSSSAEVASADALSGSGTMTILLTDEDGTITGSVGLDLSTYATVGDLVAGLDAISGVSASIDSDGHVVISADDADAGVIVTGDYESDPSLGFYDLLTGDASGLSVSDSLSTQGLASAAVASTVVGEAAYVTDDTTALEAVWSALDGSLSFDAAGGLSSSTCSVSSYVSALIDDLADRAEAASDAADSSSATASSLATAFTNTYGVNVDEETALLTTYQQDYEAAAQIVSTAQEMWDALLAMMN
ncbi:flagellar hook-associated protein FlgK [Oleispirillum naphthae]|uniref:flagellar hook-associated protein FlgK n=1 Tax=Oleispirillum naphthae TaxID=2838853 RepID=UPI00308265DB